MKPTLLYLDQHGNRFYAKTLKELREQLPGKVSIMFRDRDGSTVRIGYVIGHYWLQCYVPMERPC